MTQSGEVRDSGDRAKLQQLMFQTMERMLNSVSDCFMTEVTRFRTTLEQMKGNFAQQLTENIQADYDRLVGEFEDKENRIRTYQDFLKLLNVVVR